MGDLRKWIQRECIKHLGCTPSEIRIIRPDGSTRRFLRIFTSRGSLICILNPRGTPKGNSENESYVKIAEHLFSRSLPVPRVYSYVRRRGWILIEDLGQVSLQRLVASAQHFQDVLQLYRPVMEVLIEYQIRGAQGFDRRWGQDGGVYDRGLMLQRESGYFLEAFLKAGMGWRGPSRDLLMEFEDLAERASMTPSCFLMHRDFQSRNILMVPGRGPFIIDFQGSRLGPLQYDVAALTLDPYVPLGHDQRERLLKLYVELLEKRHGIPPAEFLCHYPFVALHRLLQILGAFAFLSVVKRKSFFFQWIPTALALLRHHISTHPQLSCPRLIEVVSWSMERLGRLRYASQ
jgi:hypothetical protein